MFLRPQAPGAGSAGLASRRHWRAGCPRRLGAAAALRPHSPFAAPRLVAAPSPFSFSEDPSHALDP